MFLYFGMLLAIAQVDSALEAEQQQIRSDMMRFQRQQLWAGLNKKYNMLLDTVENPLELLYEDHLLGAVAAQEIGDLRAAIERYEWLIQVNPDASEKQWLEYLQSQTVYVGLKCPRRNDGVESPYLPEEIVFEMVNPPFEPEMILAIKVAEETLQNKCLFKGNLPIGEYRFMGRTLPITEWDSLDMIEEQEKPKLPRVSNETSQNIISSISKNAIVARDDVFEVYIRGGLLGVYTGDSEETGPAPFWSVGPLLGFGSRRAFEDTSLILGTELTFRGTYQIQGSLVGGGLSFWAGVPIQISETPTMFYVGGLLDISKVERIGLTGEICIDNPEACIDSPITALPTSSGFELGVEFGAFEKRFYNLRSSSRSDSERWYSNLEFTVVQVF